MTEFVVLYVLFISADATEKTLVDEEAFVSERVAALNVPLFCTGPTVEEEVEMDQFPMVKIFSLLLLLCNGLLDKQGYISS